jgi:hypothetical protein
MKIKAQKDILDVHGFKVFTQGHTYDVMLDKGELLAVYCDLKAMYNIPKENLDSFTIIDQ